jgi:hypothetical protein
MRTMFAGLCVIAAGSILVQPSLGQTPAPEVWKFERLDKIHGMPVTVVGHPHVIKTPLGKAIQFDGTGDALFIPEHPLAGATAFTFEAIFRPETGGAVEQRWFHLAEQDPKTGKDTDTRFLFEIRVINNNGAWTRSCTRPWSIRLCCFAISCTRWTSGTASPWSTTGRNSGVTSTANCKARRDPF